MMECDVRTGIYDDDDEDWTDTQWGDPEGLHRVTPLYDKPTQHKTINSNTTNVKTAEQTQTLNDTGVVKRMLLNDNKAGMAGLDKDRINQIIHEASKGSKFYENERQKEEKMKKRIEEQRKKILSVSTEQLNQGTLEADRMLEDFEQQRDLSRCIVHIDMDAFYAAVEMRDDPSLKDKPMAVGGSDMLSTSNYAARKFGVRAAMPGFIAKKLCPELVIVPTNFDKYTAVSKQVKAIMAEYDPNFCPMSLDEAYLDFTDHLVKRQNMKYEERTVICRDSNYAFSKEHCICDLNSVTQYQDLLSCSVLNGIRETNSANSKRDNIETNNSTNNLPLNEVSSMKSDCSYKGLCADCGKPLPPYSCIVFGLSDEEAVRELRMRIQQRTRLTASAGIAPNMMLSKVCSDKNKPNGQYKIPFTRAAVMEFIQDLPTRKISGIGKVSEAMLNALGVHTCTDLYDKRGLLYHLYSSISFNYFMRICLGIGSTTVERDSERKSMSTERTFTEINKNSELFTKLEELSSSLSEDLKAEQLKGKTVSIKIKTVNFQVRTRAHTVKEYTYDYDDILQAATELLKTEIKQAAPHPLRLRLMGVRMSNLIPEKLCQKTKQKTIIGAFKQLTKAKNEGTYPSNNTGVGEHTSDNIEEGVRHEVIDISSMCSTENVTLEQHHGNNSAPHHGDNGAPSSENITKSVQVEHEQCLTLDFADKDVVTQDCEMKSGSLDSGCNENSSTRTCGVSDINNLKPFGGKSCVNRCTDSINKHDTEHRRHSLHTNLHSTKVITGLDVNQGDSEHGTTESVQSIKHSAMNDVSESMSSMNNLSECVLTSNELSESVSTMSDMSKNVSTMNDSSENKKPEIVDNKQNMESVPPSPIIVYSDETNCRVTRSGQVGTPVSGRKSRKRSGRTKTLEQYECPVCAKTVLCKNLQSFNQHVDVCLSSEPVGLKSPDKMQSPDKFLTETICTEPLINNELSENNSKLTDDLKTKESTENLPSCAYDSDEQLTCSFKINIHKNEVTNETLKETKDKYLSEKTELMSGLELNLTERPPDDNEFDKCPSLCTDTSDNSCDENSVDNGDKACIGNRGVKHSHFGKLDIPPPEKFDNLKESPKQLYKKSPEKLNKKSPKQFDKDDKCFMSDSSETVQTDNGSSVNVKITSDMNDTHTGYVNEAGDDNDDTGDKNHIDSEYMELESVNYTNGELNFEDGIESNMDNYVVAAGMSMLTNSAEVQNASFGNDDQIGEKHAFTRASSGLKGSYQSFSGISGVNIDKPDHTDSCEQSDEDSSEENGSLLVCPVCNVGQRSADLNKFNEHVDVCLSRGAITELVKEQNKIDKNTLKRSMTTPTSCKPNKKRRTIMPDVPSKSCRSIASFFQTK